MAIDSVKVELPAEIFDAKLNIPLMHQVVVAQQAAARQGTHSTKRRGEVRGGGRKPYKQKGTGRARQGSTRAPQFVGGGVVHGPKPRDYDQRTPKKMKAAALRSALSDRARNERIHVVADFGLAQVPSTRTALAALASLTDRVKYLVVLERSDSLTWLRIFCWPSTTPAFFSARCASGWIRSRSAAASPPTDDKVSSPSCRPRTVLASTPALSATSGNAGALPLKACDTDLASRCDCISAWPVAVSCCETLLVRISA